uniref:ARA1 n=1 Tax=Arundo donax TaxID=35708 RepID=A0A0A9E6Q6_ARUDO
MKSQLKLVTHTDRMPASAAALHATGTTSETTRSALMELSHSTSVTRIDSRGTTAVW